MPGAGSRECTLQRSFAAEDAQGIRAERQHLREGLQREGSHRGGARRRQQASAEHERTDGMHRIDIGGSGLSVEENDNVVTVGTRSMNENVEINIQVPFDTSLKLHDVNGGEIQVDHVNGDVEVDVTNGRATATHISGSAIVHALNDRVLVTLDKVTPDKPMSFSSLNGDIDV